MRKLGNILLISAIMVGAPRWAGAMLAADVGVIPDWVDLALNWMNIVSGVAMGILEVLSIYYMQQGLRGLRPYNVRYGKTNYNWRFYGVLFFIVGLLGLTPFILAPYLMARMNNVGMAGVLLSPIWQVSWTVAVSIAPIFVVGGVALAQNTITKTTRKKDENERKVRKSELSSEDWRYIHEKQTTTRMITDKYFVDIRTAQNWKNTN